MNANANQPEQAMMGGATRAGASPAGGEPPPGELVARRFLVGGTITHGPSGLLCRATSLDGDRALAIRFMRAAVNDQRGFERFQHTIRLASELGGENVARVVGSGALASGVHYLVSEYFDGENLARLLSREGALPVSRAVDFARQICAALTEAHTTGIVHRDIKPSNLFITEVGGREVLKVLDFGISKQLIVRLVDPTGRAPDGVASAHYASPEQISTPAIVDAHSDLWSVGVVLYEMLTGQRPFDGESAPEIFAEILGERPSSIRSGRPELDRGLEAVVLRCLAKDPAQRFQSATALSRALEPFENDAPASYRGEWSLSTEPIALPLKSRRPLWLGASIVAGLGLLLIPVGVVGARAIEKSQIPRLESDDASPPLDVPALVVEPELARGAYGRIANGSVHAEPEIGAHSARAPASKAAAEPDNAPVREQTYRDSVKQDGMRSPADVYLLERRIYDAQGNLLDVQTRVLEGAGSPKEVGGESVPGPNASDAGTSAPPVSSKAPPADPAAGPSDASAPPPTSSSSPPAPPASSK